MLWLKVADIAVIRKIYSDIENSTKLDVKCVNLHLPDYSTQVWAILTLSLWKEFYIEKSDITTIG